MKTALRRRDWLKRVGGTAAGAVLAGCVTVKVEEKEEDEEKEKKKPADTVAKPAEKDMRIYVCGKCGYVYDPSKQTPPTPFPDLPDTWTCPKCKSPKSLYKPKT
jgi:rubredoxin